MKLTLSGSTFRDAIKASAVLFDAEIEVLATADPKSGRLILESGRNGIYCKQNLEADVIDAGQCVLAASHFSQISFQDQVSLESDSKHVSFKSGSFKGSLSCSTNTAPIESQRPEKIFKTAVTLPLDILRYALAKVSFAGSIPGTQPGIRIQVKGDSLVLSTTDQYRATLFKESLPTHQGEFDILLSPSFLHTVLGRVNDSEVKLGADHGTFRLKSKSLDVFHPSIQTATEDIEEWISTGIDYESKKCGIKTTAEELTQAVRDVASIHIGAVAYDTYVEFLIKGNKAHLRCIADHGTAQTSLRVDSDVDKFATKLSSKYTLEMLNLVKTGDITIDFWDEFVLIYGQSKKFCALIPTVAA